ncbi:MAG TPA: efflux RND transporter permease subunit [Gemmatimonadaceae bacterium]
MNPVRSALQNRSVVLVLTGFAVLLGLRALFTMPRREDPKITIRTGLVLARYPGASAAQVEEQVTRKIEERLFRHEEVRKLKTFSTSRDGVVVVNVELEEWVKDPDRFWAMLRHDMNELHATELPPSVQGPIVNSNFGDVVAMLLAVRGPHYGPRELREYLDKIDDAIRTIPEVSKINRLGEQREELRVSTTNGRLAGFGMTPLQVADAIRSRNAVVDAGTIDAGDGGRVPIAANSLLASEDALSRLLVGTSRDGRPVHLGDFAAVERQYADPQFAVRVDGESTVLLAVEMQEGHNIVKFGDEVREKIAQLRATLPPDLVIQPIADQPEHVQRRMIEFGREFLITLAAVILVTVILLPLRVAAIAAVAIPITVAITVSILNAVGIELHQVTFAGLVVALGIVVDDAIVVVDNYVEKLDHGMSRLEAAWRSPTELAVPVLAATLTIVASFLPLAYLPGAPGEFIRAMSYTVAIALMVSFAVAMLLTPLLALTLVKAGLHQATVDASAARHRRSPLDVMQSVYERVMGVAMPRKRLTMIGAVVAFVAGLALMSAVPYRFFPMNERDQFIVDLWMPAGTRLAGTDDVMRRLESVLRREPGIRSVAAFVGGGAPRFYYNHNPEPPTPNFGQLLINTASPEATTALVHRLHDTLGQVAPEGWVYVKPLQQGPVFAAPNEVRLVGDDAQLLRTYGDSVARIFEHTAGSAYVHTDWRDEELALGLHVRPEVATRLGLSDADIATQLAGAFAGAPVSTFWEGKRDIDITLRLDGAERSGMDDVLAAYVASPSTGARVPVREVADVAPEFRPSRIVRRNGVRTLTVRSFSAPDILPSVVLKAATPQLAALKLPAGMRMEFGGEKEGSAEVQGAVNVALMTSLIGVFLILLFQFRTVRHPLVIMTSIPLAVVGAALGLVVTGNPFTYTANLGLNALTGVVVRNAIILVDYANELRRNGVEIETAALLAGRRRLRPIFLTTMAAALGVTPMILSRSPLWSPMASVIAVGLVVSMIFTLVLVPVLYVVVERREERRAARREHAALESDVIVHTPANVPTGIAAMNPAATIALILLALGLATSIPARRAEAQRRSARSDTVRLTLDDAVALAMKQGYTTRMANARLAAAEAHEHGAAADLLPQLSATGNHLRSSGRTTIVVPRGALGNESSGSPLPTNDRRFDQGAAALTYTQFSLTQPVTQLWRIRQAQQLASAQTTIAAAERARAEADVRLTVERLYASVLIARAREHAAEAAMCATQRKSADVAQAVASGIDVSAQGLGATASALDAEYAHETAESSVSDAEAELRSGLALPPGTRLDLVVPESPTERLSTLDLYVARAQSASPDVDAAHATLEQAKRAVALARADFIPDVGVGLTYTMLNGVSFLPRRAMGLSIQGSWTAWDWGKRGSLSSERNAQQDAATIGLELTRDRVSVDVERAYRSAVRAERGAEVAHAALTAHRATLTIAQDRAARGLTGAAALAAAEAEVAESEAQALAADLQIRIARAELTRAIGG